jgi:hypothetical protein
MKKKKGGRKEGRWKEKKGELKIGKDNKGEEKRTLKPTN